MPTVKAKVCCTIESRSPKKGPIVRTNSSAIRNPSDVHPKPTKGGTSVSIMPGTTPVGSPIERPAEVIRSRNSAGSSTFAIITASDRSEAADNQPSHRAVAPMAITNKTPETLEAIDTNSFTQEP